MKTTAIIWSIILTTIFVTSSTALGDERSEALEALAKVGGYTTGTRGRDNSRLYIKLNDTAPAAVLKHVARLPDYKRVSISGKAMNDEALTYLVAAYQIEELALVATSVTDEGIVTLTKLPRLRRLSLNRTSIGDKGIKALSNLKLVHLNLHGTLITDGAAPKLAKLNEIEVLYLTNTAISDDGAAHLSHLKHLCELALRDTKVTLAALDWLDECESLTFLHLDGTEAPEERDGTFAALKKVKTLTLESLAVNEDIMHDIANMPSLERLIVHRGDFGKEDLLALKRGKSLKDLSVPDGAPLDVLRDLMEEMPDLQVYVAGLLLKR